MKFFHLTEASELIDILMKIAWTKNSRTGGATTKQFQFVKKLQDSNRKLEITSKYLGDIGNESIDELTLKEAYLLNDRMRGVKGK